MSNVPTDENNSSDEDADIQTAAMGDHLRSDVKSWLVTRSEGSARQSAEFTVPQVKQSTPAATRAKPAKSLQPAAKSPDVKKKPFSMSYDGVSDADYITYRISRGAR